MDKEENPQKTVVKIPKEVRIKMKDLVDNYEEPIIGYIGDLAYSGKARMDLSDIYVFGDDKAYYRIYGEILMDREKRADLVQKPSNKFEDDVYHINDCTMTLKKEGGCTVLHIYNKNLQKREEAMKILEEILKPKCH